VRLGGPVPERVRDVHAPVVARTVNRPWWLLVPFAPSDIPLITWMPGGTLTLVMEREGGDQ
jgi:hypothetical protein